MRRIIRTLVPPVVSLLAVCAVWEVVVRLLAVPAYLLPPPSRILAAFVDHAGTLARGTAITGRAPALNRARSKRSWNSESS